ncbi:MAG: right-handed parallel beta-helix repeat-containing protein [Chitinivibrionales bacterium]|nr:right-handed parallel beta-helix repeat-containing protein [Chitinivibrionales bacterium]
MFPRQKGICLIAKLVLPVAFFMAAAQAATYYVDTAGNDSNLGSSGAPFHTITYAYSKSTAGDSILVQPGTYTGMLTLNKNGTAGTPLTIRSVQRLGATINGGFNSSTLYCVFINNSSYNIIDGFKITNAYGTGVMMFNAHNVVLKNNEVFSNGQQTNRPNGGGGNGIYEDSLSSDNRFIANYVHDNGLLTWLDHGMYLCGINDSIVNNIVVHNRSMGLTVAGYSNISGWKVYNNVFAYNGLLPSTYGKGIDLWGDAVNNSISSIDIENNIIVGNGDYGIGTSAMSGTNNNVTIKNNIVYGNGAVSGVGQLDFTGINATEQNTIQQDPRFKNGSGTYNLSSDYQVQSGSPAINAGVNLPSLTTDFSGNPRPVGAGYDIGAYEYVAQTAISVSPASVSAATVTVRLDRLFALGSGIAIKSVSAYDLAGRCLFSMNSEISDALLARINKLSNRACILRIVDGRNQTFFRRFMGH